MSEMIEAADELIEDMFPPKRGGLVERHRARVAIDAARQQEMTDAAEPIEQGSYKAVKVAQESPEVISTITYTIQAGAYAQILPAVPYRYRATIRIIPANPPSATAYTAVLAKDSGAALGGTGYTMLSTDAPLVLNARSQLYVYNSTPSGTVGQIQVSVIAEMYAPEKH
jgi:hypothetical protein